MAVVGVPNGILWLPSPKMNVLTSTPSFTTNALLIDALDESAAFVFRIPRTGNVAKVLWGTRTVTAGSTVTIRGETLDESATPAVPSGTLYHANFIGTHSVATSDDNLPMLTTLAGNVPVIAGHKIAILIKHTDNNTNAMQVAAYADDVQNFPYCLLNTGVSPATLWSSPACVPVVALEYDDGSYVYVPGIWPFHALSTTTFNSGSSPDETGLRFRLPFSCRVSHWWAWMRSDGDFAVNLYDADGTTKLLSASYDKDERRQTAADEHLHSFFATADLVANTFYRLVIEATTATSISTYDFSTNTAASMDAFDGGQDFHRTSAKDPSG